MNGQEGSFRRAARAYLALKHEGCLGRPGEGESVAVAVSCLRLDAPTEQRLSRLIAVMGSKS